MTSKLINFLICGIFAAILNLIAIQVFFSSFNPINLVSKSFLNLAAIEISLITSFFLYRTWIWPSNTRSLIDILFRQLPLYQISSSLALLTRLALFPILDLLGVDYRLNALIGIILGFWINYLSGEKLILKNTHEAKLDLMKREIFESLDLKKFPIRYDNKIYRSKINRFSIIIPCHNEEGSIYSTVSNIYELLVEAAIPFEILLIDDHSNDSTLKILKSLSEKYPNVSYIQNPYPNGFGFAVRFGLENFTGDAVTIVMADSSDSPKDIVRYYYALNDGYDCVFGSRFCDGGKVVDYPVHKLIVNRVANLFIQMLMSVPYDDITNAFKAYRREVIIGVSPLISHHFNLTVEIPLKAIIRGYRWTTLPIEWHNRKTGISKLKIKEMGSRYLFIVLWLFLEKSLSQGDYICKKDQNYLPSKDN